MRIAERACVLAGVLAGMLAGPAALAGPAVPPPAGASVVGAWMTEDRQGVVRIEPCVQAGVEARGPAGKPEPGQAPVPALCGRVVGISDFPPGGLRDLHGALQCGLVIIHDLRPVEDNRRRGSITNPDDGRVYGAIVWVADDGDLRLRGFVGLPILGSTQHWPRFTGRLTKDCHFVQG